MISERLRFIAECAGKCGCAADIGCDHGYVPVYMIKNGLAGRCIGMDLRPGPLENARRHVSDEGLQGSIELRLSDGAEALLPGEADTVIIAGMGGELVCRIMEKDPGVFRKAGRIVLSPQSELFKVREFLEKNGYPISCEKMCKEDGKYYFVIICSFQPGRREGYDEAEYCYGRFLAQGKDPLMKEYLERELELERAVLERIASSPGEAAESRRKKGMARTGMILGMLEHYR